MPSSAHVPGRFAGVGLGLLAINSKLIDPAIVTFVIIAPIGIVIGVLWGMYGPAKKPKGPPPGPRNPRRVDHLTEIT